jgi:hypothetical protein
VKVTVDIDCTPEEARRFLGLPDVSALQEQMIAELQERMQAGMASMDPEVLLKTWLPVGMQGLEQMQRMFWEAMASGGTAAGGAGKSDKDSKK